MNFGILNRIQCESYHVCPHQVTIYNKKKEDKTFALDVSSWKSYDRLLLRYKANQDTRKILGLISGFQNRIWCEPYHVFPNQVTINKRKKEEKIFALGAKSWRSYYQLLLHYKPNWDTRKSGGKFHLSNYTFYKFLHICRLKKKFI